MNGILFDNRYIKALDLRNAFNKIFNGVDGSLTGCNVTRSGKSVYISPGYLIAHGGLIQITGVEEASVETPSNTTYCLFVIEIDLSKENTTSNFLQGSFKAITSTGAYPTPRKDDINASGTIYQMPIAKYVVNSSGTVTDFQTVLKSIDMDFMKASQFSYDSSTHSLYIS